MGNDQTLPVSPHFELHKLTEGVYAALALPGGSAIANAGIIDLGERTVVFDTLLTPAAATDLRTAAERLTGRPVTTVINSHYHHEHVWGNQVFAEAEIVATSRTYDLIDTQGRQEVIWHQEHAARRLTELEMQYAATRNTQQRRQLEQQIIHYKAVVAALPHLTLRLPTMTFDARLVLRGSRRRIEAITYGAGHTESDAILYLPDDGILFTGDLLTVGCHPYLADGDPGEIDRILGIIRQLNPRTFIPGRGAIGTANDVQAMADYLTALSELALIELTYKLENPDQLEQKIAELAMPKSFAAWSQPNLFAANLRFLYQRLMKAYAD